MSKQVSLTVGGREMTIETGRIAKQASGSAYLQCGDTVVLVTACASREPRENINFFPLICDYREYTYAAGKIPGGFFKREGRLSERETLISRMIDRPLRPMFPDEFRCETQVIASVFSLDPDVNPDVMAINGASAALCISDIPFPYPIGAVRVGYINDELVVNPTFEETGDSKLDLIVVGSEEAIVMVEAGTQELSEEIMIQALNLAHDEIKKIVKAINDFAGQVNKKKREVLPAEFDADVVKIVEEKSPELIRAAMFLKDKLESERTMDDHKKSIVALFPEDDAVKRAQAGVIFGKVKEDLFRNILLEEGTRPDGRKFDEIRNISSEVSLLPRTHGSALFTRGETQALVAVTLGTGDDAQRIDDLMGDRSKSFMLHYNFPPFSVGEVRMQRGAGRREIGHGALAERAVHPVLPEEDAFPYTIRVVSDILESNGSSSMATVCGATLALQDAGVSLKSPVAGIAMGLVKEKEKYVILSDIAGFEDHYGDMDFKVTGTKDGITALQMDIKITGVTSEIMAEALEQARKGRLHILGKMSETMSESRENLSRFAPQITTIHIPQDKIGLLIGPGGKNIRSIVDESGAKIDIEDDGSVHIASVDAESSEKAIARIEELTATAKKGKTYLGKITKVVDFGAFVEIFTGTEGLLHISELSERRISDIHQEVRVGDKILVKVLDVEGNNKIKLSRRAVLKDQREGVQNPDDE
jgi:polyribonucleotide nucleotidyltransferase